VLAYERHYPGQAAIWTVSGAVDLSGAFTSGAGYSSSLQSAVQTGNSLWYQSLAAGNIGHTPASSPTYWKALNTTTTPVPPAYLDARYFAMTTTAAWAVGTTYAANQLVYVPYSGSVGGLSSLDPNLNTGAFTNVPIIMFHCSNDSVVPSNVMSTFSTNVTASGTSQSVTPNITTYLNGTSGFSAPFTANCNATGSIAHLDPSLFIPSTVQTFFDTYRTKRVLTTNKAPGPNTSMAGDGVDAGTRYAQNLTLTGANPTITGTAAKGVIGIGLPISPTFTLDSSGTAIASAATIAPTVQSVHITGTTAIVNITVPSWCATASTMCRLTLIPDGLWTTTAAGNIAIASTAVVSKALILEYDPGTSKWYPSY
jgi:hypothetical protein